MSADAEGSGHPDRRIGHPGNAVEISLQQALGDDLHGAVPIPGRFVSPGNPAADQTMIAFSVVALRTTATRVTAMLTA
jgi:hypothetical protein